MKKELSNSLASSSRGLSAGSRVISDWIPRTSRGTTPKIITILSTYNGEKYITQQLESLLQQTYPSQIFIRDDGSTDNTQNILHTFAKKHSCIHLSLDTSHKGLRESYQLLLKEAVLQGADYICYADQDDIWLPDKTERLLFCLREEENTLPALIFSDVEVVDKNLRTLHPSLASLQKLNNHTPITLKKLLFYCPALGCTMMFNRALAELIIDLPEEGKSINPDKWALILAALKGNIIFLGEPTLLYRQHSKNTVGALLGIRRNLWSFQNINFLKERYQIAILQAQEIEQLSFLSLRDKKILRRFQKMFLGNYIERLFYFLTFIFIPPHWKRKCGLMMSLFLHYSLEN